MRVPRLRGDSREKVVDYLGYSIAGEKEPSEVVTTEDM